MSQKIWNSSCFGVFTFSNGNKRLLVEIHFRDVEVSVVGDISICFFCVVFFFVKNVLRFWRQFFRRNVNAFRHDSLRYVAASRLDTEVSLLKDSNCFNRVVIYLYLFINDMYSAGKCLHIWHLYPNLVSFLGCANGKFFDKFFNGIREEQMSFLIWPLLFHFTSGLWR